VRKDCARHLLVEDLGYFRGQIGGTPDHVELYQRIFERHPGQERKIVFMTGGAFAEPAAQFIESVHNPKLKKPFTGTAVRALVMSVARSS